MNPNERCASLKSTIRAAPFVIASLMMWGSLYARDSLHIAGQLNQDLYSERGFHPRGGMRVHSEIGPGVLTLTMTSPPGD